MSNISLSGAARRLGSVDGPDSCSAMVDWEGGRDC